MVPSEYYSGNNNLLSLYNKVATLMGSAEYAEAWTGVKLEMVDKGGGDTSLTCPVRSNLQE